MYKFYGQNLQDKFIFERYFRNKKYGVSIECGSFDGVSESSTKFFEDYMNWSTINIEIYPDIFEKLKNNRPNSINLSIGLSDNNDKKIFTHAIHPLYGKNFGNGSIEHIEDHKKELIRQNCTFENFYVNCDTYRNIIDNIMQNEINKDSVDLFVLDVEGYELNVINGMVGSKFLPKILCVEYPLVGLDKLNSMLINLGYTFDTINFNNAFYIKNDTNI